MVYFEKDYSVMMDIIHRKMIGLIKKYPKLKIRNTEYDTWKIVEKREGHLFRMRIMTINYYSKTIRLFSPEHKQLAEGIGKILENILGKKNAKIIEYFEDEEDGIKQKD